MVPTVSETDRIFFSDGYRLAETICGRNVTLHSLLELMEALYDQVDMLIESFINRCHTENKAVECRKGCSWCCHQPVMASTHEMIYLGEYIRRHTDIVSRGKILERAEARQGETGKMNVRELFRHKSPCPLLEENSCMVYPGRPMACRIYLSSSVRSCMREFHEPGDQYIFPALYAFPLRSGRMMNEGVYAWFREKGMKMSEWTLDSNLLSSMNEPGLFYSWTSGKTVLRQPPSGRNDIQYLRETGFL